MTQLNPLRSCAIVDILHEAPLLFKVSLEKSNVLDGACALNVIQHLRCTKKNKMKLTYLFKKTYIIKMSQLVK